MIAKNISVIKIYKILLVTVPSDPDDETIMEHFDQSLAEMFNWVGRICRGARGIVMAVAQFQWESEKFSFASIGNIETRILENQEKMSLVVRSGVIGLNAPNALVVQNSWNLNNIMVMHSDGLKSPLAKMNYIKEIPLLE